MQYLNDTQRVEMALPAHMFMAVLLGGANCADPGPFEPRKRGESREQYVRRHLAHQTAWKKHQERVENDTDFAKSYEIFKLTRSLLADAMDEPIKDIYPPKKRDSLLRRILGLHVELIKPYAPDDERTDPRKIGLLAYYMINELVSQEYLIIPPKTAFGQALDIMLPALSPWDGSSDKELADYQALNDSASCEYKEILRKLQQKDYYIGLQIPS